MNCARCGSRGGNGTSGGRIVAGVAAAASADIGGRLAGGDGWRECLCLIAVDSVGFVADAHASRVHATLAGAARSDVEAAADGGAAAAARVASAGSSGCFA